MSGANRPPFLYLGGLRLELVPTDAETALAVSPLRESWAPFFEHRPFDAQIVLSLTKTHAAPGDLDLPSQRGFKPVFKYGRTDLAFGLDAPRTHAIAAVDGSLGAIEAAVELTLQGALESRGGAMVHAMAGEDGRGCVFLVPGRSGQGKSTLSRAPGWARVFADEAVIVRLVDHQPRVFGTPFWSEGRSRSFEPSDGVLDLLALPVKASFAELRPCAPADAAAALLACVMSHESGPRARASLFTWSCDVALAVHCVHLHFPKEGSWLSGVQTKPESWAHFSGTPSSGPSPSSSSGI